MKGKHSTIQPAAPLPIANDRPLIRREELERSLASLTSRQLTDEEREKYGPATMPMKHHRAGYYVQRGS